MVELFKFRCYQCEKLIGAPPSRFGSVVKCPKCGVELIVPSPADEPEPEAADEPDAFRPEDFGLNLEPEPLLKPAPPPPEPVGPDPIAFLRQVGEPGEAEPEATESDPDAIPELPEPGVEPLTSRKRARRASESGGASSRARDVVLPRTAAVAWALFALLGLAFAFATGLLIGQRFGK